MPTGALLALPLADIIRARPNSHFVRLDHFALAFAAFVVVASAGLARPAAAQPSDARQPPTVAGAVTVTNKGISTVPTFTIGRPAVTLDIFIRHRTRWPNGSVSAPPPASS